MEPESTSETSVNFYQTTLRYNPEDSHLHTRRRENLKSYNVYFVLYQVFHILAQVVSDFQIFFSSSWRTPVCVAFVWIGCKGSDISFHCYD
jgi:hypothetical protein